MSLRSRLTAAAGAVLVLVAVLLVVVITRQRPILTDQIDEQLTTVAVTVAFSQSLGLADAGVIDSDLSAREVAVLSAPIDGPPTGDFYLGVIRPDGVVMQLVEPVSHPEFAPVSDELVGRATTVDPNDRSTVTPFTVDSVDGPGQARTVVIDIGGGFNVVVARSTDRIDDAQRQLALVGLVAVMAVAALLGLVLWWVDRLGLQPISRLTDAAEEVAAGRSGSRVEHPSTRTETGRLGAAFNTMLDTRQEAEERQRRFVADASHELRTPLTTVRGYAAFYASGGLDSKVAVDDAMSRIGAEAARMVALVEDLLVLASLDEGRPLDLEQVDLSRLLVDIGSDAKAVQPSRVVETDGVRPGIKIRADRNLLTKAITAATTNVLRHTDVDAGLTIRASTPSLAANTVKIEIADRGQGIPADRVPMLFDRFYRADVSRSVSKGGRGLGLSIARTAIEAHGGRIWAESVPGSGTTISMEVLVSAP